MLKTIRLNSDAFDIKYLGNDLLAASLESDELKIFNIKSGLCVKMLYLEVCNVYPLRDDKLLTITYEDNQVIIWNLQTFEKNDDIGDSDIDYAIQLTNGTIVFNHGRELKISFWQLDGLELKFSNKIIYWQADPWIKR